MKRRAFIAGLAGAAAVPLARPPAALAQRAMPAVGFIDLRSPDVVAERLRAFRQGLRESGYVEGENVAIVQRFAEGQTDRLPALAADLARRKVAAIATAGDIVAQAAKAATKTIPIVFIASIDPVQLGLVTSLARPGGNLTGINFLSGELVAKRLELLRQLVPKAARVAVLINPTNRSNVDATLLDMEAAARAMDLQIQVLRASTRQDIDAAFAAMARERSDMLLLGSDTFFSSRRVQIVNLAMRHGIPMASPNRESAEIGAVMSYGSDVLDAWRQSGVYVARILKGAKPAEMPVAQAAKFSLVINVQSANTLGITVPQSLLVAADEVIE